MPCPHRNLTIQHDSKMNTAKIRVQIPFHLQRLSGAEEELTLEVPAPQTTQSLIAALERDYPTLKGAVIDQYTGKRRPKVRFFACRQDLSFDDPAAPLPEDVITGKEAFMIVGAISGG